MLSLFTAHPKDYGMTYWQHFRIASWIGLKLGLATLAISVHVVFPFMFKATASNTVKELYEYLSERDALDVK